MTKELRIDLEHMAKTYGMDFLESAKIVTDRASGKKKLVLRGDKK